MKVITLNTWGGRAGKDKILSFFEKYKDETEIFCLQEIWAAPHKGLKGRLAGGRALDYSKTQINGLQEISRVLDNHAAFFRPHVFENYGLMILVKKDLIVLEEGELFVYKYKGYIHEGDIGNHGRNIQYIKIEADNKILTVINFHGLWNGSGKGDSEDRLNQSKKIVEFTEKIKGEVILCGDFNLLPETESIKILENTGLKNLIKEFGITSTRTSHYTKPEKYADYIFTSPTLKVKDFKVLPEEVSDHFALYLEI